MSIVISARYGVCNSFLTKSFSGVFPFCLTHYDARIRASIMTGLHEPRPIEEQENAKVSF